MIELKKLGAFSGLLLSLSLTASLVACQPPKDKSEPKSDSISTLNQKAADCEKQIRQKMEKGGSLQAANIAEIETDLQSLNALIPKLTRLTYSTRQINGKTASLILEKAELIAGASVSLQADLTLNDSGVKNPFNFTLKASSAGPQRYFSIEQQWTVGEDCQMTRTRTKREVYDQIAVGQYQHLEQDFFANGERTEKKDVVKTSAGKALWSTTTTDADELYVDGAQMNINGEMITLHLRPVTPRKMREFGYDLQLAGNEIQGQKSDGKVVLNVFLGSDQNLGFKLFEFGNKRTWKVPRNTWVSVELGTVRINNSALELELPENYLAGKGEFLFLTKNDPTYDHFGAYWSLQAQGVDEKSGLKVYRAAEMSPPAIAGKVSNEDLISNDTIQAELPEIQRIAQDISATAQDREQKIAQILRYLKANYRYDDDMVNNNSIRPLTTEEALKRGKGVCQHYAVLFTAIARALKIPSRIVVGYSLRGKTPGGHAWVEAEVKEGVWQAIEPQSENGLTATQTRYYLPLLRATFLEDKNASMADFLDVFVANRAVLRPVN